MKDIAGYLQAGVAGLIATVGTVFWAGNTNRTVADTQVVVHQLQQQQQTDHDRVTALDTKISDIQSDVSEIKSDIKTLVQKAH